MLIMMKGGEFEYLHIVIGYRILTVRRGDTVG